MNTIRGNKSIRIAVIVTILVVAIVLYFFV